MTGVIYARYSSDNQRKEWIEELVLNKVIKILFDDEALDKIADEIVALLDEDNKVIPLLEAQLKEVCKSIDNVMKAIEAGIITRSTKAKLEELVLRTSESS